MGGALFAQASAENEPTLNTPRMSPEQYAKLKSLYLRKLQDQFPEGQVACLIEAPEKTDYGDIDIFVAIDKRVNFVDLANALGATGVICHTSGRVQKCSLGVPLDGRSSSRPMVVYKHIDSNSSRKLAPSSTITVDDYAQIDVEILSPDLLEWHTFYSAYGDMASMIGYIVRNLGFTLTDVGLWLRLEELDRSKNMNHVNIADKDGRIFLSDDPNLVMQFLGLSVRRYNGGFETIDALYGWLGNCRLISMEVLKVKRDNASDRKKDEMRSVFSTFFYEWLPARRDVDQGLEASTGEEPQAFDPTEIIRELRKKYREEAVDFFGKRAEYERKHNDISLVFNNATAAELLKPMISEFSEKEGKLLNEIVRGFRRYVGVESSGIPYVLETPHSDAESQLHRLLAEDKQSLRDPSGIREWVREHWDEVRGFERQRVKAIVEGSG